LNTFYYKNCVLKFEFPKQYHAKHDKIKLFHLYSQSVEIVWWLKLKCVSMRSWVQSLMDACFNVSCTNLIYKHIHHGEYANMCASCLNGVKK
jgi:hypothetical protein